MTFFKPLNIGNLHLPSNIIYAPLTGCTDFPFRQICSQYHKGLKFCEMVKMDALVRKEYNRYLDFTPEMTPIGAQICGSKPLMAKDAAKILENQGFDLIDLNCGCPADRFTKDGSGSAMLKTPELIGEILSQMVHAVNIPITVKIRSGWDYHHRNALLITQIAEEAGAAAITIHGRTRTQKYEGYADWQIIKECKAKAKKIKVIGNGDIFDGKAAKKIFQKTGCDGILIARGMLGKPWIAEEIRRSLCDLTSLHFSFEDQRDILLKHMDFVKNYYNNKLALLLLRRVICWYLKTWHGVKQLRAAINRAKSLDEMSDLIHNYSINDARRNSYYY